MKIVYPYEEAWKIGISSPYWTETVIRINKFMRFYGINTDKLTTNGIEVIMTNDQYTEFKLRFL